MRIEIEPGVRVYVDAREVYVGVAARRSGNGPHGLEAAHVAVGRHRASTTITAVMVAATAAHSRSGRSTNGPTTSCAFSTPCRWPGQLFSARALAAWWRSAILRGTQRILRRVILSSCSPHLGLSRKLAMFERLGGARAREVAECYWSEPTPAHFEAYLQVCLPLYNPTPQPDAGRSRTGFDTELLDT